MGEGGEESSMLVYNGGSEGTVVVQEQLYVSVLLGRFHYINVYFKQSIWQHMEYVYNIVEIEMEIGQSKVGGMSRVSRAFSNRTNTLENDIEVEKEYLEKLKTQRSKTQKLYQDYMNMNREHENLKRELQDMRGELAEWKNKYEIEVGQGSTFKQLEKENESLSCEIRNVVMEKAKALQELKTHFQSVINELTVQIQEHDDIKEEMQGRIDKISAQLSKRNNQFNELQSENQGLKNRCREMEKKIREDQHRMINICVEKENYEKSKSNFEHEKEKYRLQVNGKDELIEKLKKGIEECREKERMAQKTICDLQDSKGYYTSKLEEKTKEITILKKNIQEFKDTTKQRKEESEKFKEKFKEKDDKIIFLQRAMSQIQEKLRRRDIEYSEIMEKYTHIRIQLQGKQSEWAELRQINRHLREENEEMLRFLKQKQSLEKERRELVENEIQEINRFEKLLKHI